MLNITRRGVASQDLKHLLHHFRSQLRLLEPHAVLVSGQGPHRSGVVLERSNATLEELLQHSGRSHTEISQPPQSVPDEGEPGAHESLVAPAGIGDSRRRRMREHRAEHSDIHIQPLHLEPARGRREVEINPQGSRLWRGKEAHAPRSLSGVAKAQREEMVQQGN